MRTIPTLRECGSKAGVISHQGGYEGNSIPALITVLAQLSSSRPVHWLGRRECDDYLSGTGHRIKMTRRQDMACAHGEGRKMVMSETQPNIDNMAVGAEISPLLLLLAVVAGAGSGIVAGLLMKLLRFVQHLAWRYDDGSFLEAASNLPSSMRLIILVAAGTITALSLMAMRRLSKGRGSGGVEAAIWLHDGSLSPTDTTLKALLSIVIVGLGASLGREAAPKQMGALIGCLLARWRGLSGPQQKLLVACGGGAGIAAVYNVPFGAALFTLEVLLGALSLPLVAPAFLATLSGTAAGWLLLPNEPTYQVPAMPITAGLLVFTILLAPLAGVASALFVKAVGLASRARPHGYAILPAALAVFALLGAAAVQFPQVLGNGKGIVELAVLDKLTVATLLALLVLKPLATIACLGTGAPGGLFTPTIACGALLGSVAGHVWLLVWPGTPPRCFRSARLRCPAGRDDERAHLLGGIDARADPPCRRADGASARGNVSRGARLPQDRPTIHIHEPLSAAGDALRPRARRRSARG